MAHFTRRVVEHEYGGVRFRVELADPLAAGWYDHDWVGLPEVAILASGKLKPGARVFDIGAHQGVMGMILGSRVGPAGIVILVEPNAHNFDMCIRNASLNSMGWLVGHRAAVSDREGVLRFNCGLNGSAAEVNDYGGVVEVPTVTLDGLTERYGAPDVVTLDVEGFECRALSAAQRTFAANPDWCVEVHVGHGLETAGGSADQVLSHFPASEFDRYVHSDGDMSATPFEEADASIFRDRFFLTALFKHAATQ